MMALIGHPKVSNLAPMGSVTGRYRLLAAAVALNFASARQHRHSVPATAASCPVCDEPARVGTLPPGLVEASGIATSTRHAGVYYSMNDNGDDPANLELHAINGEGGLVKVFRLRGFDPQNEQVWTKGGHPDVETIQTGWCIKSGEMHRGPCILLGNVGHNCARLKCPFIRKTGLYAIWQFQEAASLSDEHSDELVGQQFWFRFPDEDHPHDVETMLAGTSATSGHGELLILTKENVGPAGVYVLPMLSKNNSMVDPAILKRVSEIPARSRNPRNNMLVDGAVEKTGKGVSSLYYNDVLFFPRTPGAGVVDALDNATPCHLPHPPLHKSEGITWDVDDTGNPFYLVVGEGQSSHVYKVSCRFTGTDI